MKVLLSNPRGFCAGVVRAIDIVERALSKYGAPVYVRKEIVHNPFVVERLRDRGAIFVEELDEAPNGALVIFSAHGVSPAVRQEARERDLRIIDATCPLVTKVHNETLKFSSQGYRVLLVGHAGHDEVIGTMGEAPDRITLVESVEQARTLSSVGRTAVVTQTTLSLDDTKEVVDTLRQQFPELLVKNDICYATQNRQEAIKAISKDAGLVLVVGARNSSNSNRLREVAEAHGRHAYLINDASELRPEWFDGIRKVAISSGASTPEDLVEGVVTWIVQRYGATVREAQVIPENVQFSLPKELA